ncbi:TetR/AcrR family transcriptional regulator [Streptomyces sp. NPDC004237]|uniref:TetR/AcrR family transcriptional regulator n=1 Tax=Streptomyces sp. NPDC004237 TaxID=3154455 RepID=UPI0033A4C6BC
MADARSAGLRMSGEQRKEQIMKAAADLFDTRGYQDTPMEAIAQQVGIRKASLYYYFPSKDALLVQMHQEMIDLITDAQQRRLDEGGLGPRELLLAVMTDLVSLMETHPGHLRVFFEHFRELPEEVRDEIAAKRDRYLQMLVDVFERGVVEGEFRVADPRLSALGILGMCNWTYQWFRPGGKRDAADVARYFYDTLLRGIGPGQ